MTKAKKPWYSKTLWVFSAVLAAGGVELLIGYLREGSFDTKSTIIVMLGFLGVLLRLDTSKPISMQ